MRVVILYFALALVTTSCRTASRNVTKEKVSIDSIYIEKKDIHIKKDSTILKIDSISFNSSIISLLSNLNLNYDGNNGDSISLTIIQKGNQVELKIKGKGKADFSTQGKVEKSDFDLIKYTYERFILESKVKSAIKTQLEILKNIKLTSKEENTSGFQFSFWLWIIAATIVIISLYWFFGRPKK